MSYISVNFSSELLIRHEDSVVYLFNRNNNAVLRISECLYDKLTLNRLEDNKSGRKIVDLLVSNGMLDVRTNKSGINNSSGKFETLFQLKSNKNPFNVLWAITSKCNLRCIYCFPDVKSVSPSFISLKWKDLDKIASQLIEARVFQVTLTGGEAFLEENLWKIVDKLYRHNIKILIISNGTVITDEIVEKLKRYNLLVGVSLDAPNEEINSITRGKNNFKRTVNGIKKLVKAKVQTIVLVTLNRFNFGVLQEHVKYIRDELNIKHITLQDLRPFGSKIDYDNMRLDRVQEKNLSAAVKSIQHLYQDIYFNLSELFLFPDSCSGQKKSGNLMQCPAGYNVGYIDFYGDMYPCTNLPTMKLGNLLDDGTVTQLWQNSDVINQLRRLKAKSIKFLPECNDCKLIDCCDGGCRGDALFYSKNLYGQASRCPKLMFGNEFCEGCK